LDGAFELDMGLLRVAAGRRRGIAVAGDMGTAKFSGSIIVLLIALGNEPVVARLAFQALAVIRMGNGNKRLGAIGNRLAL